MTFDEFLKKKKIDGSWLQMANPQLYESLLHEYNALGKIAFEQRKKFILNELRICTHSTNSTKNVQPGSNSNS